MTGDDRVRMCKLCSLNVYNISDMTASEAEAFLDDKFNASGRVCITMYRRQDGTIITDDCPVGLRRLRDSARRLRQFAASVVALALSGFGAVRGQPAVPAGNDSKPRPEMVKGEMVAPRYLGRMAAPVQDNSPQNPGRAPATIKQHVLQVRGSLISEASAWYADHRAINKTAVRAVSSACVDVRNNERELEKALQQFQERAAIAGSAATTNAKECADAAKLHTLQESICLVSQGNCLYYLGRVGAATEKYEAALRKLEPLQFAKKPVLTERIFGNLNQSKRLMRANLDIATLREKLGRIPVSFSENGPADGGIAWLSSEDGGCEFTDALF